MKRTVRKTTKKAASKTNGKSGSASRRTRSAKTSSRPRSSNRKVAQQENPFQQGYSQQAAQGAQKGVYARGGKLKKKGCRR